MLKFDMVSGLDRTGGDGPKPRRVVARYGIRYAELESGRRFSAPSAVGGDVQCEADELREVPVFPHRGSGAAGVLGTGDCANPQAEDAFYVNVWSVEGADRLPVVVFIHGGAWSSGGGSVPWYDGRHLAAGGLVVVTVNYRVGPFGHLSDDASRCGERPLPVQDLLVALRWVADNAARFGGDPERVTLAGQSAGGWYVHLLSLMPEAADLFSRAAIWSMGTRIPRSPALQRDLVETAARLSAPASLRDVTAQDLLDLGARALGRTLPSASFGHFPAGWLPHAGDGVPVEMIDPRYAAERCAAKAVMFRNTADETGTFFHDVPALRNATDREVWGWLEALPVEALPRDLLAGPRFSELSPYEKIVAVSSWTQYQGPVRALVEEYAASGRDVSVGTFRHRGRVDGQLSGHCVDLPFQFGTREEWRDAPMLNGCSDEEFERLSHELIAQLTVFADARDETGEAL